MSDLGPGEALERFSTDLGLARLNEVAAETVVGEAEKSVEAAQSFLADAQDSSTTAALDRNKLERTALSAIETAGLNHSEREVQKVIMRAKGMNDEEIEGYFAHIKELNAQEQPVMVISNIWHR